MKKNRKACLLKILDKNLSSQSSVSNRDAASETQLKRQLPGIDDLRDLNEKITLTETNSKQPSQATAAAATFATPSRSSIHRERSSMVLTPRIGGRESESTIERKTKKKKTVRFSEYFNEKSDFKENEKGHFIGATDIESLGNITIQNRSVNNNANRSQSSSYSAPTLTLNSPGGLKLKSSLKKSSQLTSIESSLDWNYSNGTVILEKADDDDHEDESLGSKNKSSSFFEYESILFPKTSKCLCRIKRSCSRRKRTVRQQ